MDTNLGSQTLFPNDELPDNIEQNLHSKSIIITDSPTKTDNVGTAINFDPSQDLFSTESDNLCDIVPHVDNDRLKEHILSIIIRRFGLEKSEINTFLYVDHEDKCANDDSLIPGIHEKFQFYVRDFRSIFYDNVYLTSQAVENYLYLVLMSKADKNVCLVSFHFQFFAQSHTDIKTWNASNFEQHCKTPFGCDIQDADYVIIPSCYSAHFVFTFLDVKSKKAYYFDSWISKHRIGEIKKWFPLLTQYVWKNSEDWELIHHPESIVQPDGSSCGIYVCMALRRQILNDVMVIPTVAWQYRARLTMTLSLLCSKLLPIS